MATNEDLSLGLDWPSLHSELATDLSGVFGNLGGDGKSGDPWKGNSFGGSGDPWNNSSFGGSKVPFPGLDNVGYRDPFGRLPTSLLALDKTQEQLNAIAQGKQPGNATGPAVNGGSVASATDNTGIDAAKIDQYIASTRPNSPLKGKGAYILQVANQYGVSVPQMLGIFLKETELGTTANPNTRNLSGIVAPTDQGLGTTRQFNGYASWEESISATAANLATPMYRGKPLAEQIGNWYVGPNAYAQQGVNATDLAGNGTVQDYLNVVSQVYAYFGKTTTPASPTGTSDNALVARGSSLLGTPYVAGGLRATGDPRRGLDCSEYTAWVYEGAGIKLPWNAQAQYNVTARIDKSQLQVGDLVFFYGTNPADHDTVTHVGMYIGNGKFLNSQDEGVTMADINSPYWQQHYYGAGRVAGRVANPTVTPRPAAGGGALVP